MINSITKIFIYILALLLLGFIIKPMPEFPHATPRTLPWVMPDVSQARTKYQYLDNGQIVIEISHVPLINISPKMLSWFYQNLPISTVKIGQETLPWYHIFHQSEHGIISIKESATNGSIGMGVGALVERKEWFGDFNSQGAGRIISFSEHGMTVKPELAGMHFGLIEHQFIHTASGSIYKLNSIIGSDLPVIGPIINFVIRHKMFTESMIKLWLRHQTEEVANLNQFLPQLYKSRQEGNHYYLNETLTQP